MLKLYEIECQRNNVTPKAFYEYCRKACAKKELNIEDWIEFEQFSNENNNEYNKWVHDDWEQPSVEIYKMKPYDIQLFLQHAYNIIMEFEFDTETKGHGYFYAMEFAR